MSRTFTRVIFLLAQTLEKENRFPSRLAFRRDLERDKHARQLETGGIYQHRMRCLLSVGKSVWPGSPPA
jgi:hypothetical protein